MRLIRFLFVSDDLPWGLQAFWKALLVSMTVLLCFGVRNLPPHSDHSGPVLLYALAGVFAVASIFTKLGE